MTSTKSREVIWGGRIVAAKISAEQARRRAVEAVREADRTEAAQWKVMVVRHSRLRPSPNVSTGDMAGWKRSAIGARPRPAFRWRRSGAHAVSRSGSSRLCSSAGHAERADAIRAHDPANGGAADYATGPRVSA
jgi:hypothetical protein